MNSIVRVFVNLFAGTNDFKRLFLYNEFNDLTGKSRKGIIALAVILALTFSALGFSIGGIKYLKNKMDDPFTNWVNMNVKASYRDKIPAVKHFFEKKEIRDSFHLDNISDYVIEFFEFYNLETNGIFNKKIRTIDPDTRLIKEILSEKNDNVIAGFEYKDGEDFEFPQCAIVMKESAIRETLGVEDVSSIKRLPFKIGEFLIYVEVFAIVKELPDLCEGLISNHFYNVLKRELGKTGFVAVNSTNKFIFHGTIPEGKKESFESEVMELMKDYEVLSLDLGDFEINKDISLDQIEVYSRNYYPIDSLRALATQLNEAGLMNFAKLYVPSNCEIGQTFSEIERPYYVAFNFNKLDKVRDFNNVLKTDPRFLMEISMDQVESKENFALVSRLTGIIAFILLVFSFLSIVFYINSLLTKHLEKIKKNLGTLKAFGLNNRFLISIYVGIIFMFMIFSVILGFIISMFISLLEKMTMKIPIIDLYDYRIYVVIAVILVITVITSYNSIKNILLKTPGDLIYNR